MTAARVTPDQNGVFDETRVATTAQVSLGTWSYLLARLGFSWHLGWSVRLAQRTQNQQGHARAPRSWVLARERIRLSPFSDTGAGMRIPVATTWDGGSAGGTLAPPGVYVVTVEVHLERTGPRADGPTVVASASAGPATITVAREHDNREKALLAAAALRLRAGERLQPDFPSADMLNPPTMLERAPAALLASIGRAEWAGTGLDLSRWFDAAARKALEEAQLVVPPSSAALAAWRRLFFASGGQLFVRWMPAGTPGLVRGLDAGPLAGSPEEVAAANMTRFDSDLRTLLGLEGRESLRISSVGATADGTVESVSYEHFLTVEQPAGASPESETQQKALRVRGDSLTVHIRRDAMGQGQGRVVAVSALWNRVQAPTEPLVSEDAAAASAAAAAEAEDDGLRVTRVEGPEVIFPQAGVQRTQYMVWLMGSRGPWVAEVDARTGEVVYVERGGSARRVVQRLHPYSFPASTMPETNAELLTSHNDYRHCSGLPYTEVCETVSGGRCAYAAADGTFDRPPGWTDHRVGLSGPYYRWHRASRTVAFEPFSQPLPSDAAGSVLLQTGPLATGGTPLDRASKDMLDALVYSHLTFQRAMLGYGGLDVDRWPTVRYQVWWDPLGYACTSDDQCERCADEHSCNADRYWDMSTPGAACVDDTGDCEPPGWKVFCDTTVGLCDWVGYPILGWTSPEACLNGEPLDATADVLGWCIELHPLNFWCEEPGAIGSARALTLKEPAEALGVDVVAHENTHFFTQAAGFQACVGYGGESGRLSGFLSEDGFPESAAVVFYPDAAFWDDRPADPGCGGAAPRGPHLGARFFGDPVGGANRCGGPERDVAGDSFRCPENGVTCSTETCAVPIDYYPSTPLVDPFPDCAAWRSDWPSGRFCMGWDGYGSGDYAFERLSRYENGHWFQGLWARYAALVGRAGAIKAFGAFLSNRITTATVAARLRDSLYDRLAVPLGSSAANWSVWKKAYQAYRAFLEVTHPFEFQVGPRARFDDAPSTWWLGELLPPRFDPWRAGEFAWEGALNSWDPDDWSNHAFWAYGGEEYAVELASLDGASLYVVRGSPPEPGEGGVVRTEFLLRISGGAASTTFRAETSGPVYLGVGRDDFTGRSVGYEISVRLVGDDYPDAPDDAVALPPVTDGADREGELGPGDQDVFKVFVTPTTESISVEPAGRPTTPGASATAILEGLGSPRYCVFGGTGAFGCRFELWEGTSPGRWYRLTLRDASAGTVPYRVRVAGPRFLLWGQDPPQLPCSEVTVPAGGPHEACIPTLATPSGARGGPLLAGVLYSADQTDNLWLFGIEDRAYAVRLWLPGGYLAIHPPRYLGGTTADGEFIAQLRDDQPAITFVAPVTGWYRLRVNRPEAGGFHPVEYPIPYAVQAMEAPRPAEDYPELDEWTGAAPGECAP